MNTHFWQRSLLAARTGFVASAILCALGFVVQAQAATPIKIAVLAPVSVTPGKAIVNGAQLAAKHINAAGGLHGRPIKLLVFDTKFSSTGAINAMKKAVLQDHVVAVTGVFTSEASLPLMPYAKRLDIPLILESASTKVGDLIHNHYDQYKNVFQLQINSYYVGQEVCDAAHDLFAKGHSGTVSAVIMSEKADWTRPLDKTYEKCLPKAGIKVEKLINYAVNTKDYSPIFSQINALKPDLIVVGMAHTGLRPVVQWHQERVPALMFGMSMQAGTSGFWKASNGAAQGVIGMSNGAGGAPVTSKTPAFYHAYVKRYGQDPMLEAYTSYDMIYAVVDAIEKAGNTDTANVVSQLAKLNMVGVTGRIQFYGRDARFTHALKYGPGLVRGVAFQWQNGKQVVVWPTRLAQGSLQYPDFVPKP